MRGDDSISEGCSATGPAGSTLRFGTSGTDKIAVLRIRNVDFSQYRTQANIRLEMQDVRDAGCGACLLR